MLHEFFYNVWLMGLIMTAPIALILVWSKWSSRKRICNDWCKAMGMVMAMPTTLLVGLIYFKLQFTVVTTGAFDYCF